MGKVQIATNTAQALWQAAPGGELVDIGRPHLEPLGRLRLQHAPKRVLERREVWLLGLFAVVLHGSVIYWLAQKPTVTLPVVPPEIPPMTIEFSQPAPPVIQPSPAPPPPPEPTPPPVAQEPPPPVEDEFATKPPPKPNPKPKPPAPKPVPKPAPKPVEQVAAPLPATPVPVPVATPAPVAPKPVTPASASAGYLHNPAPEYPPLAQRRGWEGQVLLRVHVLASGKPGDIQVQKTSGRDALDEAAVTAVKRWSFVPAKQGDVAQDGWVTVPIDFKLH